ncbi:MAG: alkaline phosphatase PhoX [Burkholderiaceae bacterium]
MSTPSSSRRGLLKGSAAGAAAALSGTFGAFALRQAHAADGISELVDCPYGPVAPVADLSTGLPLLQLPPGFSYKSYGWTGDRMADGLACPGSHDGMAVVRSRRVGRSTEITLIRNHERGMGTGSQLIAPAMYDTGVTSGSRPTGGTTNLVFRDGDWLGIEPSLGGTLTNCAGGPTPWGTWLTCEEVGSDAISSQGKRHGYVFEVAADAADTSGEPLVGLGRFTHEAVAIDPSTGVVYLTEDLSGKSGFYRFLPNDRNGRLGSLAAGGTLQMAKVKGMNNVALDRPVLGERYELEWVDIADPDRARGNATGLNGVTITSAAGPFCQGWVQGALRMRRGEGIWYFGGSLFVVDTSAGASGEGAVWRLDLASMQLSCVFAPPRQEVGDNPDNITVSPRGGVLLCEDGDAATDAFGYGMRLMGLTDEGDSFIFAKNNVQLSASQLAAAGKSVAARDYRNQEFAGACFDPSGRYLFVNIQTPGITFAISGPWAEGTL